MSQSAITFIGGGNMAGAIYGGLLDNGFDFDQISVVDPSEAAQEQAKSAGLKRVYATLPKRSRMICWY